MSYKPAFHFTQRPMACDRAFFDGAAFFLDFLFGIFDAAFNGKTEIETAVFGIPGSRKKFGFSCMDVEFLIPEEECVSPVLLLGPHAKDIDIEMKACLKIFRSDHDVVDGLVFHGCLLSMNDEGQHRKVVFSSINDGMGGSFRADVAAAGGEDFFFPVADSLAGAGKAVIDVVSGFLLVESDRCARMEFRRDDAVFAVIEHPDSHCSFPAIHSGEDSFFYFIEIDQHGWLLFILLPRQQGNGFDVVPRAHLDVLNIFSVCF